MDAMWIILAGSLVAINCSILGSYLVLRKTAMVGDAIAHAVLPGIIIAFLLSGSATKLPLLLGAAAFGVLTTFLIETFRKKGKMQSDAALGLTFTLLFAIGIILASAFTGDVHIDEDCVLHGKLEFLSLDAFRFGDMFIPKNVIISGCLSLLILGFIAMGYRPLYLTTFDPAYAASIGISTLLWHYLLMTAVSITTVISFESVGAILVVAFLVLPASTAYLLTDKLLVMILLACGFGILASILGYHLSVALNSSTTGCITSVMGLLFFIIFLFAPRRGVLISSLR